MSVSLAMRLAPTVLSVGAALGGLLIRKVIRDRDDDDDYDDYEEEYYGDDMSATDLVELENDGLDTASMLSGSSSATNLAVIAEISAARDKEHARAEAEHMRAEAERNRAEAAKLLLQKKEAVAEMERERVERLNSELISVRGEAEKLKLTAEHTKKRMDRLTEELMAMESKQKATQEEIAKLKEEKEQLLNTPVKSPPPTFTSTMTPREEEPGMNYMDADIACFIDDGGKPASPIKDALAPKNRVAAVVAEMDSSYQPTERLIAATMRKENSLQALDSAIKAASELPKQMLPPPKAPAPAPPSARPDSMQVARQVDNPLSQGSSYELTPAPPAHNPFSSRLSIEVGAPAHERNVLPPMNNYGMGMWQNSMPIASHRGFAMNGNGMGYRMLSSINYNAMGGAGPGSKAGPMGNMAMNGNSTGQAAGNLAMKAQRRNEELAARVTSQQGDYAGMNGKAVKQSMMTTPPSYQPPPSPRTNEAEEQKLKAARRSKRLSVAEAVNSEIVRKQLAAVAHDESSTIC